MTHRKANMETFGHDETEKDRFWHRKIAAFLHDTPEKQFNIANHEEQSLKYLSIFNERGIDARTMQGFFL